MKKIEKRKRIRFVPNEFDTFKRLVTETYPNGFISIVSDTWDLWKVCTEYLPKLKNEILARDGKVVIRPDSGNPANIICGFDFNSDEARRNKLSDNELASKYTGKSIPEIKGVIELLWDTFGGTTNEKGFKVLDPHIGAIYGDAITLEKSYDICRRLADKGFASSNIVFGIGSFTYQFNTRDTYGFAMKATYGEVNGVGRGIFKDPITDTGGVKKSLKGLISVRKIDGNLVAIDECSWEQEKKGELKEIYRDGRLTNEVDLKTIRERILSN